MLQYVKYLDPSTKLRVLAGLADNCELASPGGEDLLRQAAKYRQELFAEMTDQNMARPGHCAECRKEIDGGKVSEAQAGLKAKIVAATCGHLFHLGCLQDNPDHQKCPTCDESLLNFRVVRDLIKSFDTGPELK